MDQLLAPPTHLTDRLRAWSAGDPTREAAADTVAIIAAAGARLAQLVAAAPLRDTHALTPTATNASGDEQKPLDVQAEALFVDALRGGEVAAVCSEESADPIQLTSGGSLIVTLDPVDGSSNLDINAPIGTIFSVLPTGRFGTDVAAAALQPGTAQLAAGVIVYGPSTVLALTVGEGTDIYARDPAGGQFALVRPGVRLSADSQEYAINASNARHWGAGIRSYVNDLVNGSAGPRGRDFNMRWLAALVADTYRILLRGGIFLYPGDERPGYAQGRIRLVYEANPVAFLCEQAGGAATDGLSRILDLRPVSLHQRTPFVFGSRSKVDRVRRYLIDPASSHQESPLFGQRGLFRTRPCP